jgi:hypothetical protein
LGVDLSLGKRTNELAKRSMLRGRIEQVSHSAGLTWEPSDRKPASES